jgi:transcriptional regulator with XRE-family HTH domain
MEATENQRIKILRETMNLNQREFALKLGMQPGSLSDVERGKVGVSNKIKQKLKTEFYVNLNWLEKGEGDVIDSGMKPSNVNGKIVAELNYPMQSDQRVISLGNNKWAMIVPLVPEYGYAGYVASWKDPEYGDSLLKHMIVVETEKEPQGEYLAIEVAGESMENWTSEEMAKQSFRDGEIVTGRNIPQHYWKSRFHIHKYKYFVIVHEEGIFIKRIIAHDVENGIITCNSLNPNKDLYPDFELKLSEVSRILNIIHPKR